MKLKTSWGLDESPNLENLYFIFLLNRVFLVRESSVAGGFVISFTAQGKNIHSQVLPVTLRIMMIYGHDLCVLYHIHLLFMLFDFFGFHSAEWIGLYGFLKITIRWIMNWIIWNPKNNQILFSTSCGKKPIINTKCHTIDIDLFIWFNSISLNLSTFCFLSKVSLPDCDN